ncbi:tyrosine-type recombinase/integrase [Candidatus Halocynthiibacter alkanivorans]|uniref:tyrosine-type recombinase/integrase n=1 Tax=Candidatus Halocynthiibacter alkanivorans TaxID=2267619 RepID=UPI00109D6342|nr:tyrosine-type recombinase/integrase [Candidatus Halocynthiibacter alkanivorans]
MYRAPAGRQQTKKRQPPARLPRQFLSHVKRWSRNGCNFVVENNQGIRVAEIRKGWARCKKIAMQMAEQNGVALDLTGVTPHTLRHTCATWLMQGSANKWDAAGFLGMSAETLERVYGTTTQTTRNRLSRPWKWGAPQTRPLFQERESDVSH